MSEEKKPDRMVSHANAMDFAEAVCRASGWPVYDEEEDLRRAREAWDAQEEAEEDDTLENEIEMDPNETLNQARNYMSIAFTTNDKELKEIALTEMMEAFQALDEWLVMGGFSPANWMANQSSPLVRCEESNYVEVKFYLTPTEAQDWVDAGPPWWASKNVEQYLRNSKTTS